ncbi:MAG: tRNA pseudouridine(55) synthase TruB [Synergistaceae bacterium]|nr:tRNA pseudouridine(55) synthase TruB [Synergistaceae bacterium]
MLTGLLLLNKPVDMRSTKCVELVRNKLGRKTKVGHGGTLDSTASGLLIVLIGLATRLSNFVMDMPKCYEVTAYLGIETSTDDASGDVTRSCECRNINERDVDLALTSFLGWRMQAPPDVSAVHVDGKRAHELARGGHEVLIEKKPVFFASVERTSEISEEGRVSFRINCGKGTYVRSFVRDLGRLLGCGAHVCELKRLSCGPLELDRSVDAGLLDDINKEALVEKLLPPESLCAASASYLCCEEGTKRLINGLNISLHDLKRENFARYSSRTGNVIVRSEKIFSICQFKDPSKPYDLYPEVNIINDRSI